MTPGDALRLAGALVAAAAAGFAVVAAALWPRREPIDADGWQAIADLFLWEDEQ